MICIFAPMSVYLGIIPFSLATFAVYIAASVTDVRTGCAAVVLYVIIGAVGFPVFSGFTGGFQRLFGMTGGYIIGYIPCSIVIGIIIDKLELRDKFKFPFAMAVGTAVCYAFGTLWYMLMSGVSFLHALSVCVVPFLLTDSVKIAAASVISINLRSYLEHHQNF